MANEKRRRRDGQADYPVPRKFMKLIRKDVLYALKDAGWNCKYAGHSKRGNGEVHTLSMRVTLNGHQPNHDGYRDVERTVKSVAAEVEMVIVEYEGFMTSGAKSVEPQIEQQIQQSLFSQGASAE